jgi:hypothetical protein
LPSSPSRGCYEFRIEAQTELWVQRAITSYNRLLGIVQGWMFRDTRGAPCRQKEYDPRLFAMIQEGIAPEGYGRSSGLRYQKVKQKGLYYACHKAEHPTDTDIKQLARWRSIENAYFRLHTATHTHLTAFEREPALEDWVRSWWDEERTRPSHHSPAGRISSRKGNRLELFYGSPNQYR